MLIMSLSLKTSSLGRNRAIVLATITLSHRNKILQNGLSCIFPVRYSIDNQRRRLGKCYRDQMFHRCHFAPVTFPVKRPNEASNPNQWFHSALKKKCHNIKRLQ